MYCKNCGTHIPEGSKYCPNCGTPVDHQNDAANNDQNNGWRSWLTPKNIELFAAVSLFFPFFLLIVQGLIIHSWIDSYRFRMMILHIDQIIFLIFTVLGTVAMFHTIRCNPEKQTRSAWLSAVFSVISLLSLIGVIFHWSTSFSVLSPILCTVYGLDLLSRLLLQKKGIESPSDPAADFSAYKQIYDNYRAAHPKAAQVNDTDPYDSYFDGDGATLFGYTVISILVAVVTLNLATPWMICKIMKWRKTHTVISGRRLDFDGTGSSLFGYYLLWSLLCIVTFGIYGFFMHVAMKKWEMKHTFYADDYSEYSDISLFDGDSFQYFGYAFIATLLLTVTCGLAYPWVQPMIQKWETSHEVVCNDRLYYDGTATGILVQYLIVYLLTIVTLGIYSPWGTVSLNKYIYAHTHAENY